MNVVDSSGWLEYFSDGPNADVFSMPLNDTKSLIVPTISIYEVFKIVLRERSETDALQAIELMKQGKLIELTDDIAISAAKISIDYKLPMADSIILSTAYKYNAVLWTQDDDFEKIPGVRYFPKIRITD